MTTRAASARTMPRADAVRVRFDIYELDEQNACLLRNGQAVALAPRPFAVLCALARQPGSLLTKQALLDEVWGHQFVSDGVLKTVINELRTVLSDDARHPRFIETVSRRGYRFIASTRAVMPPAPASDPKTPSSQVPSFVGRAKALSRLRFNWDLACNGRRTVVWVAGEPGIGKTMLIEHFVAGLGDVACIRGQCVEQHATGEPYLPVLEALSELCRRDSDIAPLLRAVAPTWLLQLPWLSTAEERDALQRQLAGVGPDRMLREMGELLDRYAERRPLLVVTEDLHWSDRSTIQLIDYIARRRGGARLMWLASFRLAEVVASHHPLNLLRHELRLHGLCEEIILDPFSEKEVADYVAERSPLLASDEAFVRDLYQRSDGVPLFVASITTDVMARAAQGGDDADARAHLVKAAVPQNLAAIIDHYIAELGNEERALLSAAAVCGVEFRVDTVSDALQRDAASVAETCAQLARAQLWLNAPREGSNALEQSYAFRHALFHQALHERTPASARAQLHCKVGAALERERAAGVPVTASELAMHFERGRELMPALRYYGEAAEDALAKLAPAQCMSLAERALRLLPKAPEGRERDAVEIALATLRGLAASVVAGLGAETKSSFQRAYSLLRDVAQHPMRTRLMHGFGLILSLRGDYAEALAVAERAEALSTEANDPVLMVAACVARAHVHQLQGRSHAARTWIERGLDATERFDQAPSEMFLIDPQVSLLGLLGIELLRLGLVGQARARLQRAHARAHQLRQPMGQLAAMWFDALFEVRLGDTQRVAVLAGEMRALVDKFGLAQGRGSEKFAGWAEARMGQPRDGYRKIRHTYEQNKRLGRLAGSSEVLAYAAEALVLAGDWEAAQLELHEAFEVAEALGERMYLPQLFQIEAAILRAGGQPDGARSSVCRAIAEARAQETPWFELLALVELCEHKGATVDDRSALAALVDRLPEANDTGAVTRARVLLDKTSLA